MKHQDFYHKSKQASQLLRQAICIARNITRLASLTGIAKSTLTRISNGNYKGSYSTRAKLEAFIEQNENKIGRPIKKGD